MKRIFPLALFLLPLLSNGQNFTITRVEVVADKVNLYYDLADSDPSRGYTIKVFSSKDNYITALEKVSGDVGLEVKVGGNRKIVWNAKEELGPDFNGKVALEVRGRIYIPFIRLDNMYESMKRGKPYKVTWTGGTQQNILNFDLYKGESKVTSFPNVSNVGYNTFVLPTSVKPSKDYRFIITDTRNKDQIVLSEPFAVKRKVPLLLKVVPVILLGGAIAALSKGTSGPENIPNPPETPE